MGGFFFILQDLSAEMWWLNLDLAQKGNYDGGLKSENCDPLSLDTLSIELTFLKM